MNGSFFKSCRGRDRTFTRQLAIVQSSVVDPGRINIATETALCYVCPVILTPETRGSLLKISLVENKKASAKNAKA